jgi:prepilin-type N-terminal cleavage/methylation domain-containing protein
MKDRFASEGGFTLVELLVVIMIFGAISTSLYLAVFAGIRGGNTADNVVQVSEEARLGLNRMIRDTREAKDLVAADADSYEIGIDFNLDGDTDDEGEQETFTFDPDSDRILLTANIPDGANPTTTEPLAVGVSDLAGTNMFTYSSNQLEYDYDPEDGIASCAEIDDPPFGVSGGNGDNICGTEELPFVTNISYALQVSSGDDRSGVRTTEFFAEAQLRNRR